MKTSFLLLGVAFYASAADFDSTQFVGKFELQKERAQASDFYGHHATCAKTLEISYDEAEKRLSLFALDGPSSVSGGEFHAANDWRDTFDQGQRTGTIVRLLVKNESWNDCGGLVSCAILGNLLKATKVKNNYGATFVKNRTSMKEASQSAFLENSVRLARGKLVYQAKFKDRDTFLDYHNHFVSSCEYTRAQ